MARTLLAVPHEMAHSQVSPELVAVLARRDPVEGKEMPPAVVLVWRVLTIWRNRGQRATLEAMSQSHVRRATTPDAAVVARLLFDFNTEFQSPTPTTDELTARFRRMLALPDVIVLLAGDDEPVGLALLTLRSRPYFDGPLAQLDELYVRPHLRNQGLGTALLGATIRLGRERDAGEVHINVDEVDADTRRFHERHGFVNIEPGQEHRMLSYLHGL